VEDPVVYREDLTDGEWAELRRRLGEEERFLEEMFGLELEVRAEGVAARARDPQGGHGPLAAMVPSFGAPGAAPTLLMGVGCHFGTRTLSWA
jgi:hypothetical protein